MSDELLTENIKKKAPKKTPIVMGSNEVIVTDIRMSFSSMIVFMVKWIIASIPAVIILFLIGVALISLLVTLFGFSTEFLFAPFSY